MNTKSNKPIVIKIGGSTLGSGDTTLEDLVSLQSRGILPVVVHGGGNKVSKWLQKMGISAGFVRGLRVTDREALDVVIAVLAGLINKELVGQINSLGGKAMGLSGIDGGLLQGQIESPELGYVGRVTEVNIEPVKAILDTGYIPVIAPGALRAPSEDDPVFLLNVNADAAAGEIAAALGAERLIFFTDVPGVCQSSGQPITELSAAEAGELMASGVIAGGMIPKVEACLRALAAVSSAQIVDGRQPHALLAAIENQTIGTRIK